MHTLFLNRFKSQFEPINVSLFTLPEVIVTACNMRGLRLDFVECEHNLSVFGITGHHDEVSELINGV